MWKAENREQFEGVVADLLQDPDVLSMRDLPQHNKHSNCFDHSLYVAYLSFLVCRHFNWDYVAAARGGLLHDFYLRNWEDEEGKVRRRRLWLHPHFALENAQTRYDLSEVEKDIIVKHMWPLTRPVPKHKESFVVSMADKFCAIMEMCSLYRVMRVKKHLGKAVPAVEPAPAIVPVPAAA